MKEIERKFLVLIDKLPNLVPNYQSITQAYMHEEDPMTRIRITSLNESMNAYKAYITLKGIGLLERDEFEFEIPVEEAKETINLWGKGFISKLRYNYFENDVKWEIDFFSGPLEGLVIAEVELESPDQELILPEWIGQEVTNESDYTNVKLALNGMPN